jgi:hypothetical protein
MDLTWSPNSRTLAAGIALVGMIAVLLTGCGGSQDRPQASRTGPSSPDAARAAANRRAAGVTRPTIPDAAVWDFQYAVLTEEASGFCDLTLPSVQREAFAAADVPAGGTCAQRAQAMFDSTRASGEKPWWALAVHGDIGVVELSCASVPDCATATVMLEHVPQQGGGTTTVALPLTHDLGDGLWRIGPF